MKNTLDRLTTKLRSVLRNFSEDLGKSPPRNILLALKDEGGMAQNLIDSLGIKSSDMPDDTSIEDLLKRSYFEALRLKQPYVGTEHFLLALLQASESPLYPEAKRRLSKMTVFPRIMADEREPQENGFLDIFAVNLNLKVAAEIDKDYVHREGFELLLSILLQNEKPNPLIVGETGVGKEFLVYLLADRMNSMDVPSSLLGYQIYEIDILSFITGNAGKGNLESTLSAFFTEISSLNRVIIYLKNFENLFFSTNTGVAMPLVYGSFKSQLEESGIRYIATCSSDMHSRLIMDNPQALGGFSTVDLSEPDEVTTKKILEANADFLGSHHNVIFTPKILDYIYDKADKNITGKKFPQKGIDLMDQSGAKVLLRSAGVPEEYKDLLEESVLLTQGLEKSLEVREYDQAVKIRAMITSIEERMLVNEKKMFDSDGYRVIKKDVDAALKDYGLSDDPDYEQNLSSLNTLEKRINKRIIGQENAVSLVSRGLLRARLGLRSRKRPLGNFLFLGPTGVGKTELAKVLSDEFFGENKLIRLDMSDFGEKHNVARLVGAPPGYVGYGEGGELTGKIEREPDSLVLFDEIEKAHPDVLNILLQIMEEGELIDAKGTTFDFSSAVIVLTSNLGTEIVHRPGIGFEARVVDDSSLEKRLKSNLKKILKPELLNRLDEIVVFKRLKKEDQYKILDLLLLEIRENLKNQDIKIRISSKVKEYLLDIGYSEEYGARALRRTVEREFLDRIAEVLLNHRTRPLKLSISVDDNIVTVKKTN